MYLIGILAFFSLAPSFSDKKDGGLYVFFGILYSLYTILLYNWNHIFGILIFIIMLIGIITIYSSDSNSNFKSDSDSAADKGNSNSDSDSNSYNKSDSDSKKNSNAVTLIVSFLIITTIIWLLFNGIPKFTNFLFSNSDTAKDIDSSMNLDTIKTSLRNITESFRDVSKSIEIQSVELDNSINELLKQVSQKELELQELNQQTQDVIAELDHYKKIASISKEEAQNIRAYLNEGQFTERIISFILGIISSLIVRLFFL